MMIKREGLRIAIGLSAIIVVVGIWLSFREKKIKKIILDNGLTVLLFKTTETPRVFMQMTYAVGAAVEASDERGIAHVIEHMLLKGTHKLSEGDVSAIARKYGSYVNGQTSWDFTRYFFEVAKNNWHPFIPLFADLMQNARFDKQHFASEIKTILQELNVTNDIKSKVMTQRMFQLSFPPNHPYHFNVIGYKDELTKLTVDQLKRFYHKYYRPDNAVFFMIGDFNVDEAILLIKKNFESIKNNGPALKIKNFPAVVPQCSAQYTRYACNVRKPQLGYCWVIPGLKDKNEEIPSLLESLLYERFYHALVKKNAIAYTVSTRASKQLGAGLFIVTINPIKGKTSQCSKRFMQELKNIIKNGFSNDEIVRVLKNKERFFYERMSSFKDFAYVWSKSYLATLDEMVIFNRPDIYKKGAIKELSAYVGKYLDPLLAICIEAVPFKRDERDLHKKIKKQEDAREKMLVKNIKRITTIEGARFSKALACPQFSEILIPKPDRVFQLPNGLNIVLCKSGQEPLIGIDCCLLDRDFLCYSLDGILVELMLKVIFAGNKQDFFKNLGVKLDIDATGVKLSMLNSDYIAIIKQLGYMLAFPEFSEEELHQIKQKTINFYESRNGRSKDLLYRVIKQIIYNGHPYGWSFEQAVSTIKEIAIQQVIDIHKKQVNANSMVIVVVGNFDLDVMQKVLENSFAALSSGPSVNNSVRDIHSAQAIGAKNQDISCINSLITQVLYKPSTITIKDSDFVPILLLNYALFTRQGSRLFAFREQYGLFYGGYGGFAEDAGLYPGFDYVGAKFSVDKLEMAENLLRNMIKCVGDSGLTYEELESAKQLYFMDIIKKLSSNISLASLFTYVYTMNLGFDYYDKQIKCVRDISLAEVNKVAAKYFTPDNMFRIRIGSGNFNHALQ